MCTPRLANDSSPFAPPTRAYKTRRAPGLSNCAPLRETPDCRDASDTCTKKDKRRRVRSDNEAVRSLRRQSLHGRCLRSLGVVRGSLQALHESLEISRDLSLHHTRDAKNRGRGGGWGVEVRLPAKWERGVWEIPGSKQLSMLVTEAVALSGRSSTFKCWNNSSTSPPSLPRRILQTVVNEPGVCRTQNFIPSPLSSSPHIHCTGINPTNSTSNLPLLLHCWLHRTTDFSRRRSPSTPRRAERHHKIAEPRVVTNTARAM